MEKLLLVQYKGVKAQSWSMDIVLAVIVFLTAFFIFYALLNANPNTKVDELKKSAYILIKEIASGDSKQKIIDDNEINVSRLNELKNISYEELKRLFRIEGDFCLYFEDDKGNIVLINNTYKGIGAENINVSGTPCSQK